MASLDSVEVTDRRTPGVSLRPTTNGPRGAGIDEFTDPPPIAPLNTAAGNLAPVGGPTIVIRGVGFTSDIPNYPNDIARKLVGGRPGGQDIQAEVPGPPAVERHGDRHIISETQHAASVDAGTPTHSPETHQGDSAFQVVYHLIALPRSADNECPTGGVGPPFRKLKGPYFFDELGLVSAARPGLR